MLAPSAISYSPGYGSAQAADSVCFTAGEADSLIAMFDDMVLETSLLRADLAECRALSSVDSSLAADTVLPAWVPGWLKSPWLWFGAGLTTGMVLAK